MFISASWASLIVKAKFCQCWQLNLSFLRSVFCLQGYRLSPFLRHSLFHLTSIYWTPAIGLALGRQWYSSSPSWWLSTGSAHGAFIIVFGYVCGERWERMFFSCPLVLPCRLACWVVPFLVGISQGASFTCSPLCNRPHSSVKLPHSIPYTVTTVHTSVRKLIFCYWSTE